MKKRKRFKGITASMLALLLAVPFALLSGEVQVSAAEDSEKIFSPQELEQLLAPIALYPDALLAQVVTAATYPLEVVEANRLVKKNPKLKGEALLRAAKDKDWEPSIKAMLEFPDVLAMMDEQLEWTKKLGDAFIAQQGDCMDTVQRLRQKAHARGNLKTSAEQVIIVEPDTQVIIIKPRHARIIYVPVYDPRVVYGVWWYPAYPPYYFYPRRYIGITFFPKVFVGVFWGTWSCNWHHHQVYVNINYYKTFTKTYYHRGDRRRSYKAGQTYQPWKHSPRHRQISRHRRLKPSTTDIREYKQVTVRPSATYTKVRSRPAINSSTQSTEVQTNPKKVSAPTSKRRLIARSSTKSQETVELKSNIETEENVEKPTGNSKGKKVKKTHTAKGKIKDDKEHRAIKSPLAHGLHRNRIKFRDFKSEGIGKGAAVLPEGFPKALGR